MTATLWILLGVAILMAVGVAVWHFCRRKFLSAIPIPFDRNAWHRRWMSRRGSMSGRVLAKFPTNPLPPEGDSQAELLIYYEFLRGLYWSATPIQVFVVVNYLDGRLTNNPDGAAMPVAIGRVGRASFTEEMSDQGFIEFEATVDSSDLLIIGDFRSPAFDESGTFSLNYLR